MHVSKLTRKAVGKISPKSGRGLFAAEFIKKDEWIAEWSGEPVYEIELSKFPADRHSNCVQIGPDTYLVPTTLTDGDFVNHSCEPNSGVQDLATLVALRDIMPGEEITYDYAMTDTSAYDEFTCLCGTPSCRHQITGNDWRLPELRRRYEGYFSFYVEEMIRKEVEQSCGADAPRGTQ
jgi:SET domain-containing protein